MKYKVIEEFVSYVELKADNEPDALWDFLNNLEAKYVHSSRNLVKIEKIGDFERPVCKVTIPDNPKIQDWMDVGKKISMTLRKEGFDQPADNFFRDYSEDIQYIYGTIYDTEDSEGYTRERLEKVAEPYVKLEIID